MTEKCEHMEFAANVSVGRITKEEGGAPHSFMAHVKIECAKCHRPFQFLGLEMGLHMRGARMSVDGQEARLSIAPVGEVPQPLDRFLEFGIRGPGAKLDS